jgi:hypothetical protein
MQWAGDERAHEGKHAEMGHGIPRRTFTDEVAQGVPY